jgi:hypothetical protein
MSEIDRVDIQVIQALFKSRAHELALKVRVHELEKALREAIEIIEDTGLNASPQREVLNEEVRDV